MRTTTADPRFEVRESRPGTGLGLFAKAPIKKGDFILEYTGEKLPNSIADTHPGKYLFEIDDKWTINGEGEENTARYINHDCYPNVEAEIDEDDKIMITAIRGIKPEEELTIDYGDEYFDEFIRPGGCKCASCEKGLKSPHVKS
jgi:SET domain-containing protein